MMKKLRWTLSSVLCLMLLIALGVQYRANRQLHNELSDLQKRYKELEETLAFSQMLVDDLQLELQSAYNQSNHMTKLLADNPTAKSEAPPNLTGRERYELQIFNGYRFKDQLVANQAREIVNALYLDFVNSLFRNDAERRLQMRNILVRLEEQRLLSIIDYTYGQNNNAINTELLAWNAHTAKMDEDLAEVLSAHELDAFSEFRMTELPSVIRQAIKNRIDGANTKLNEYNKKIVIDTLADLRLAEQSQLSFEGSLKKQQEVMAGLEKQFSIMEEEQVVIAERFIRNYIMTYAPQLSKDYIK